MKEMPDNSVDSIVTDPPYELGFMGKSWDATGIAFNVQVWQEALRVIKPGGHLIAFSGSRTYHRMAVAIEDAGFQIRDQIMWVYGSGFPKSMDISKQIDKARNSGLDEIYKVTSWIKNRRNELGLKNADLDAVAGTNTNARHWTDTPPNGKQPSIPTQEQWLKLKTLLGEAPDWINSLILPAFSFGENWQNREITGEYNQPAAAQVWMQNYGLTDKAQAKERKDVPNSDAAKQWQGWGTALKPAHEPMVLARKPLIGTVANNVLTYGTGGLNIDGSRVGRADDDVSTGGFGNGGIGIAAVGENNGEGQNAEWVESTQGRWPANFIHDGSDEVVQLFPDTKSGKLNKTSITAQNAIYGNRPKEMTGIFDYGDSGSAARFFYCAKASKRDRNEGLDGFEVKRSSGYGYDKGLGNAGEGMFKDRNPIKANHHPTVKPTSLMQYLVRLVTPPNGIVLDPFMGSGSTGKACAYENFDFIGIDQSAEYVEIARARIFFAIANNDEKLPL